MPKNAKQFIAIAVIGGLAALSGGIAVDLTDKSSGVAGFGVQVAAGAAAAGLGFVLLGGKGAKLA